MISQAPGCNCLKRKEMDYLESERQPPRYQLHRIQGVIRTEESAGESLGGAADVLLSRNLKNGNFRLTLVSGLVQLLFKYVKIRGLLSCARTLIFYLSRLIPHLH